MTDSAIVAAWRSGDTGPLATLLAEDVTFSSPVADYHGRESATHMLGLIATVLGGVEQTGRWGDERDSLTAFTARAEGHELQGLLREERREQGGLVQVTLFLRPYRALRAAIARMRQLVESSPLPGRTV